MMRRRRCHADPDRQPGRGAPPVAHGGVPRRHGTDAGRARARRGAAAPAAGPDAAGRPGCIRGHARASLLAPRPRDQGHHRLSRQSRHGLRLAPGRGAPVRDGARAAARRDGRELHHRHPHRRRVRRGHARAGPLGREHARPARERGPGRDAPGGGRARARRCAGCACGAAIPPTSHGSWRGRERAMPSRSKRPRARARPSRMRTSSAPSRPPASRCSRAGGCARGRTSMRSGASLRTARELDSAAVARARVFVDRRESAANEAGDLLIPRAEGAIGDDHVQGELGEVLLGRVDGRRSRRTRSRCSSRSASPSKTSPPRITSTRARWRRGWERGWSSEVDAMPVEPPTLADVRAARERLAGLVLRTPLVRLQVDDAPGEIYLKLECLQPIGSFKLRGATNAMALAGPEALRDGVYTASAGNMAQGVAWSARRLGLAATAIVPEHAPQAKLSALARLGAAGREGAVRRVVAAPRRPRTARSQGALHPSRLRPRGHGRQRDHRARDPGGPPGRAHRPRALRRGRALLRHRHRHPGQRVARARHRL